MKMPKTLGMCADLLYTTRQDRYKLQKEVNALKELESAVEAHLIKELPRSDASGIAGKLCKAQVTSKVVPQVKDWDAFFAYVAKKKAWGLVQKRCSADAIEERWELGVVVPGTEKFTVVKCSLSKL